MSDAPKFVFVRGQLTLSFDGREIRGVAAPSKAVMLGEVTRTGVVEFAGVGDMLDLYMRVEPKRASA